MLENYYVHRMLTYAARVGSVMTGVMYGEDTVTQGDAVNRNAASWAGALFLAEDEGSDPALAGRVFFKKPTRQAMSVRTCSYNTTRPPGIIDLKLVESRQRIEGCTSDNIFTMSRMSTPVSKIAFDKYAPGATYEIANGQTAPAPVYPVNGEGDMLINFDPGKQRLLFVLADRRCPMVLYAPGNWIPYPDQNPYLPIYFKVPSDSKDAGIVFGGSAKLFDPKGKPFPDDKPVTGEIKLPVDRPGLWSFQPVITYWSTSKAWQDKNTVRVVNLPPFFAFGDPAAYFEPPLPASSSPAPSQTAVK
jgi:hypothetical protein